MATILDDSEAIKQIRQNKFKVLAWNPTEKIFRRRPKFRSKLLNGYEVPFSLAAQVKFRRSVFGTYLDSFNYQQIQDKFLNENKMGITKSIIKNFTPIEAENFQEDNNASDDVFSLLVEAVKDNDCITWEFVYERFVTLRIADFHITVIDEGLRKFRNLRVLVLSGNWIKDIPGKCLPRNLQFIECFANEVASLKSLCKRPPGKILHIGLGRNKLTNESNFKTLEKCGNFDSLRTLDLSDNDIYSLLDVLEPLKPLKMLSGLQLEGNPCATCFGYKDAVLGALPHLLYLDNTQVLKRDRKTKEISEKHLNNAALIFTCHRIIGLPAPPKEKGVVQTIHFEVNLPLLEEIVLEVPEEPVEEIAEAPTSKGKKGGKDDKKPKSDKSSKKSAKSGKEAKGGKAPSPYQAEDEYEKERKSRVKNMSFKTERTPWAKVIQLPEEALVVESPEKDLTAIRDTFRSCVNVKVVYLKVQPPEKPKKGKGGNKGKADKKDKKGKDKKGKDTPKSSEAAPEPEPKEPQETILKKVTLANFFCDLHNVNWSDKTVDFYWAAHPKSNPKAIPVEGSLRAIIYVEGKGKKEKKGDGDGKKGKGKSETDTEKTMEVEKVPSKQFLPNIFTCQIGFGLKRLSRCHD